MQAMQPMMPPIFAGHLGLDEGSHRLPTSYEISFQCSFFLDGFHIVPNGARPAHIDFVGKTRPEIAARPFSLTAVGRDADTDTLLELFSLTIQGGVHWIPAQAKHRNCRIDHLSFSGDFDLLSIIIHGMPCEGIITDTLPGIAATIHQQELELERSNDPESTEISSEIRKKSSIATSTFQRKLKSLHCKESKVLVQSYLSKMSHGFIGDCKVSLSHMGDLIEIIFSLDSSVNDCESTVKSLQALSASLTHCWESTEKYNCVEAAVDNSKHDDLMQAMGEEPIGILIGFVMRNLLVFSNGQKDYSFFLDKSAGAINTNLTAQRMLSFNVAMLTCLREVLRNEVTAGAFAAGRGMEIIFTLLSKHGEAPFPRSLMHLLLQCLNVAIRHYDIANKLLTCSENSGLQQCDSISKHNSSFECVVAIMAASQRGDMTFIVCRDILNWVALVDILSVLSKLSQHIAHEMPSICEAISLKVAEYAVVTAGSAAENNLNAANGSSATLTSLLAKTQGLVNEVLQVTINVLSTLKLILGEKCGSNRRSITLDVPTILLLIKTHFFGSLVTALSLCRLVSELNTVVDWKCAFLVNAENEVWTLLNYLMSCGGFECVLSVQYQETAVVWQMFSQNDLMMSSQCMFEIVYAAGAECSLGGTSHLHAASSVGWLAKLTSLVMQVTECLIASLSADMAPRDMNQDNHHHDGFKGLTNLQDLALYGSTAVSSSVVARVISQFAISEVLAWLQHWMKDSLSLEIATDVDVDLNAPEGTEPASPPADKYSLSSIDNPSRKSAATILCDVLRIVSESRDSAVRQAVQQHSSAIDEILNCLHNDCKSASIDSRFHFMYCQARLHAIQEDEGNHLVSSLNLTEKYQHSLSLALDMVNKLQDDTATSSAVHQLSKTVHRLEKVSQHGQAWNFIDSTTFLNTCELLLVHCQLVRGVLLDFGYAATPSKDWDRNLFSEYLRMVPKNDQSPDVSAARVKLLLRGILSITEYLCQFIRAGYACAANDCCCPYDEKFVVVMVEVYDVCTCALSKGDEMSGWLGATSRLAVKMAVSAIALLGPGKLWFSAGIFSVIAQMGISKPYLQLSSVKLLCDLVVHWSRGEGDCELPQAAVERQWSQMLWFGESNQNRLSDIKYSKYQLFDTQLLQHLLPSFADSTTPPFNGDEVCAKFKWAVFGNMFGSISIFDLVTIGLESSDEALHQLIQSTVVSIFQIIEWSDCMKLAAFIKSCVTAKLTEVREILKESDCDGAKQEETKANTWKWLLFLIGLCESSSCAMLLTSVGLLHDLFSIILCSNQDFACLGLQGVTTIYKSLSQLVDESMTVDDLKPGNCSNESVSALLLDIAEGISQFIPQALDLFKEDIQWPFVAQSVLMLHLLPPVYMRQFLAALSTGFTVELVAVKLWLAFEDNYQLFMEATEIRKNLSTMNYTSDELEEFMSTDNGASAIAAAQSAFSVAAHTLKLIIDVTHTAFLNNVITASTFGKIVRSSLADPRKILIRYQRSYALWAADYVNFSALQTSTARNGMEYAPACIYSELVKGVSCNDEFEARHTLIAHSLRCLVDLAGKTVKYFASKQLEKPTEGYEVWPACVLQSQDVLLSVEDMKKRDLPNSLFWKQFGAPLSASQEADMKVAVQKQQQHSRDQPLTHSRSCDVLHELLRDQLESTAINQSRDVPVLLCTVRELLPDGHALRMRPPDGVGTKRQRMVELNKDVARIKYAAAAVPTALPSHPSYPHNGLAGPKFPPPPPRPLTQPFAGAQPARPPPLPAHLSTASHSAGPPGGGFAPPRPPPPQQQQFAAPYHQLQQQPQQGRPFSPPSFARPMMPMPSTASGPHSQSHSMSDNTRGGVMPSFTHPPPGRPAPPAPAAAAGYNPYA